jgi:hypothetical protein
VWQTYEEVCQKVMRIGSAIRSLGVEPVSEERLMSLSVYVVNYLYVHREELMATNLSSVDGQGAHCGIYGSNCPEWVMAMQVTLFHFRSRLFPFILRNWNLTNEIDYSLECDITSLSKVII